MKINLEWLEKQKNPPADQPDLVPDAYVLCIIECGERLLDLLEALPENQPIDADALITEASKGEGITGNMSHYIALIAVKCHSRGEEFRRSFNKGWGKEDAKGLVNPAIVSFG